MPKLTLSDLTNLQNESTATSAINANNTLIETALENTLSRDGTSPNQMTAQLDMNSNRIINLADAVSAQEPVTLSQFETGVATSGAAPSTAQYVTLATSTGLSAERVLTAGTNITLSDAGAGSTVTIAVPTEALTKVDDTNVTLTLGGSPTTALIDAVSLTLGWTGALGSARGGTGVANNSASTITISGNFATTLTISGTTALTLPTSGTVATTSNKLSAFAATTSAELAGVISDETGSGLLVFATEPTFTTSITGPLVIGGTAAGSTLTLKSTSGVGTTDAIVFQVGNNGATEGGRFVNTGKLILGHTASLSADGTNFPKFQLHSSSETTTFLNANWNASSVQGAWLLLAHSRSNTVGTHTVLNSGDELGRITFRGSDGTNFKSGAWITAEVDGTPGANDMPGRLIFSTTADGAATATDRLILDSAGVLKPATNDGVALGTTALQFSDLFLASGSVINFNAGDVTLTHAANLLAFAGASSGYTFDALLDISAASAGQIKFPATQNASADANTLDDYEEGTWTPAGTFATPGDLNIVASTATGTYTKVGRILHLAFNMATSTFTHTTAAGNFRITGLPFSSGDNVFGSCKWSGVTNAAYTDMVSGAVVAVTYLEFRMAGSGQALRQLQVADMPTGGALNFGSDISVPI